MPRETIASTGLTVGDLTPDDVHGGGGGVAEAGLAGVQTRVRHRRVLHQQERGGRAPCVDTV